MKKIEIYNQLYSKGLSEEDRLKKVLKILKTLSSVESFLDIGCGDGSLTIFLAQILNAHNVKAVEIAQEGVDKAREKGIDCYKIDLDYDSLPFEDRTFDFVFCGEVIEHLFDPDHLIEEIYRVLKPGGRCIITTPNLGAWHNRLLLLMGYQPYLVSVSLKHYAAGKLFEKSSSTGREHIRFFTLRALKCLLGTYNFKIESCVGAYTKPFYAPFPLSSLVLSLEKFFSNFPSLATSIIVEVVK
jgi:methionine biosynthesis protein MetW